jgi:predicted  nucleic acid-binding Zn-ribbon protein
MERVALPHSGSRARRRWARTALALVAVLSTLSATFLAFTPAATSQQDPVAGARDRLTRAQADANAAQAHYEQAVNEREQAQAQINDLEQSISSTREQEAVLRSEVATRAVALYKSSGTDTVPAALDPDQPMEAGRKVKFDEAADQFYAQRAQQLHEKADQQQQAQADLQRKHAELDDEIARLEKEKADLDQKVARANRGVEIADKIALLRAQGDPVMGPTVLTADEMMAWYRSSRASPRLSGGMSVEQLAQIFVDEGTAENVRGDVAFAQAYIETGGFSAGGSDNNFSGLGACNGCGGQNRFPTALDGIRAQIQLLKAYAGGGELVNPASPYWWGPDPVTAAVKFDSFGGKGSAPTWRTMGNGKWASNPNYASEVMGIYDRMIAAAEGS